MSRATGRPVRVGLVQINNSFSGQNYLPYAVGLLQAYAEGRTADPGRYQFLLPLYRRIPVREAVDHLLAADVVGFSAYVWNIRISLEIARRIKQAKPETLIVFGGPQVPDRAEAFLRANRFIDLVCHGEGEAVFLQVLEEFPARSWEALDSVSYLAEDSTFIGRPRAPRIAELSGIPSPYLGGVFAPLMRANPGERWLALWETNRGCPFSCTFCDWGSATAAKVYQFDLPRLFREVEWFAEQEIEFVFCCDANFGMLPRDLDLAEYVARVKKERGYPQALSVQNTKNATEKAYRVQKLLADAGLNKGVTISLQSVHAPTLEAIRRKNISSASFAELQRRFTRDGIETYSDLILGLPGETYDAFADGVAQVIADGQHNRIQFNNLSILPNAEMGDPEYRRKHGLVTVPSKIINVHGSLQESEEVQEYQELVVASRAMPPADWVRTRAFCWMAALLHFDKVLQIPLVLLHEACGVGYRELLELFSEGDLAGRPVLAALRTFFRAKALDIQQGGEEYCRSERWLNIYWPADELALIDLCTQDRLADFYREAGELLQGWRQQRGPRLPDHVLADAVRLNRALLKLPFQADDLDLEAGSNVWEFYRAAIEGRPIPLEESPRVYHIDRTSRVYRSWEEWCREVVWYGNKKGAYLYGNPVPAPQLEGHF
jgi:radical SAM superfamily enzyme YgiQ (UPF0313 family)